MKRIVVSSENTRRTLSNTLASARWNIPLNIPANAIRKYREILQERHMIISWKLDIMISQSEL